MSSAPVVLLAAVLALAGSPGPAAGQPLGLAVEKGAAPRWQGLPVEESAGTPGMASPYPAPNVGGLIAAIITHALIVQSGRSSELQARQDAADKVLDPYRSELNRMTAAWLLDATRARLAPQTLALGEGLAVSMLPTFSMTPDRRAIVLDNAIRIQSADNSKAPRFEGMVRVVSAPREEQDPTPVWAADEGQVLRDEVASITAHSIELALTRPDTTTAPVSRTQRFRLGSLEKMERGQLLFGGPCRVVLRNLRDWLMSVPVTPDDGVVCHKSGDPTTNAR